MKKVRLPEVIARTVEVYNFGFDFVPQGHNITYI